MKESTNDIITLIIDLDINTVHFLYLYFCWFGFLAVKYSRNGVVYVTIN